MYVLFYLQSARVPFGWEYLTPLLLFTGSDMYHNWNSNVNMQLLRQVHAQRVEQHAWASPEKSWAATGEKSKGCLHYAQFTLSLSPLLGSLYGSCVNISKGHRFAVHTSTERAQMPFRTYSFTLPFAGAFTSLGTPLFPETLFQQKENLGTSKSFFPFSRFE